MTDWHEGLEALGLSSASTGAEHEWQIPPYVPTEFLTLNILLVSGRAEFRC